MPTPTTLPQTITNGMTGELTDTAAAWTAINTLTDGWLPEDGTTDIGPLLQTMFDNNIVPIFQPIAYNLNTSVFLDVNNQQGHWQYDFNGATIKLGSGLSTSTWSRNDSGNNCRWGFYVNNLRSAVSAGVVTVADSSRATGSGGGLRTAVFRNCTFDGQAAYRGAVFANRTACTFDNVVFYRGRACHTWWDYTDGNTYRDCYSRSGSGPGNQVFVEGYQQGDGVIVSHCKADSSVDFGTWDTCRGAVIDGDVTGALTFDNCTSIVINGAHLEALDSLRVQLTLRASQVILNGCNIYEKWSSTVAPIAIDDTATETGTHLVLNNCVAQQLYNTTDSLNTEFGPLISVTTAQGTTRIIWNDVKGQMTSTGMAGKWADRGQPRIVGPAGGFQNAIDSAAGRAAIAGGTFDFHRNSTGTWVFDTAAPQLMVSMRQSGVPVFSQVLGGTMTGLVPGGTLTNGTNYYYACAVLDALGNYSQASTEGTAAAGTSLAIRLLITTANVPAVLIVWRKDTTTGVLATPGRYAYIPIRSARTYLYDTGGFIGGRPWITTSVPVPNTVAAANNTVAALVLNGVAQTSP